MSAKRPDDTAPVLCWLTWPISAANVSSMKSTIVGERRLNGRFLTLGGSAFNSRQHQTTGPALAPLLIKQKMERILIVFPSFIIIEYTWSM